MTSLAARRTEPLWGPNGLAPAIVQDMADGRVLMLGYVDREALAATLQTGAVHFHSRSRDRLWRKGETSGNELRLASIALDCDGDALLLEVDPVGPTCHRGTRSCFDEPDAESEPRQGFAWLEVLWATIADRATTRPAGSYTVRLLEAASTRPGGRSSKRRPSSSWRPRTTPRPRMPDDRAPGAAPL